MIILQNIMKNKKNGMYNFQICKNRYKINKNSRHKKK